MKTLSLGQSFEPREIPDGLEMSAVPVRGVAGGWEIDARGVRSGFVRLRGRDEDALSIARSGAAIPIVPGDYGVLQYGLFGLFFQYTEAPAKELKGSWGIEALVLLAIFSSVVLHAGGIGLLSALTTPPPIPKPIELTSPEELAARFGLRRAILAEPAPPAAAADSAGGSGVKDPGAQDKKKQGGGQKIAGTEGKFGKKGPSDRTELDGDVHPRANDPSLRGLSEVLASDTGEEIKRTLKTINTVSDALSGLNAANVQLGGGTGTNLRGTGAGGGGRTAGAFFGAGTLNTGAGVGNGGGLGAGTGGPGGAGAGGRGAGGAGAGAGRGAGTGAGAGAGGTQEARVSAGATPAAHGGLSPDQVRRVVVAHEGALRACYESEAQRNPNLRGGLTVSWQIDPAGAVPSASVASSTLGNPRVEGCVLRQVRTWKFPTNDAATSVNYPFKFGVGG